MQGFLILTTLLTMVPSPILGRHRSIKVGTTAKTAFMGEQLSSQTTEMLLSRYPLNQVLISVVGLYLNPSLRPHCIKSMPVPVMNGPSLPPWQPILQVEA
jgi:hypothetical protein